MAIQWFPGHMNKAKKAIIDRMKSVDMVIEVLDARLPGSSANPLLESLSGNKPKLKILNKRDLADDVRTQQWLEYYNGQSKTQAIALDASERGNVMKVIQASRQLVPNRSGVDKPLRVLICGIPNVGKSTLINSMIGKKSAKTGNEPGITKSEQRLFLADDFWLYDTPGMLWPKIIVPEGGYNLAASGAVGRNALDEEEVSLELIKYLSKHYRHLLVNRYNIKEDEEELNTWREEQWLETIARRRGTILGGGRIDYQKAAEIVLTDFRSGHMGKITLELPREWINWLADARVAEAKLREDREKREAERK